MESTGVYWIPAFEVLEARGFDVILVNARYAKNVPGRKTDVSDAGWLRQLHSYSLLRGSFASAAGAMLGAQLMHRRHCRCELVQRCASRGSEVAHANSRRTRDERQRFGFAELGARRHRFDPHHVAGCDEPSH